MSPGQLTLKNLKCETMRRTSTVYCFPSSIANLASGALFLPSALNFLTDSIPSGLLDAPRLMGRVTRIYQRLVQRELVNGEHARRTHRVYRIPCSTPPLPSPHARKFHARSEARPRHRLQIGRQARRLHLGRDELHPWRLERHAELLSGLVEREGTPS